ncbi:hypothetical protein NIES4106_62130 (plasmid) [Fischerella sp. NIES-4106]|nr:hypothetical protein NIES4106_62130 [Fischerella sp. NIES-4106]
MTWKAFKKGECSNCGEKGKQNSNSCQENEVTEVLLCRTAAVDPSVLSEGYKMLGLTKCGTWAKLVESTSDKEWSQQDREEWLRQQKEKTAKAELDEQQRLAKLLSIDERDKQYRKITSKLPLDSRHRKSLEKRGLTKEEIDFVFDQHWIRSWNPGQRFFGISQDLAGVAPVGFGGEVKLLSVPGIAISACDGSGNMLGFQVGADDRQKFGKYLHLSSARKGGNGPHLPNGELPLHTWKHPDAQEITETWLVEGSLKSLIAASKIWRTRKDIQVIGASGGQFFGSQELLTQELQRQTTKRIVLLPDAGTLTNSSILKQYQRVVDYITSLGYTIDIGWWEQFSKEDPDADELEDISAIGFIQSGHFFALANSASLDEVNSTNWAHEQWVKSRKYTPDIVVSNETFRFPANLPDKGVGVGINAGLGRGKTEAEIEFARTSPNRAHFPTYRNNLSLQTIARAEKVGVYILHIQTDGKLQIKDPNVHLAYCPDSIKHVDGFFEGCDIYLDEICSTIDHIITGGTLGDEQALVIEIFTKALRECNRFFAIDGNLSDTYMDFLGKISGKKIIKVKDTIKSRPCKFTIVDGVNFEEEVKKKDKSPLIKKMLEDGVRPWINTDSKESSDALSTMFGRNSKSGLLINRDTSGEDFVKDFLSDPDEYVEKVKPDYVISSPTMESGNSKVNKDKHFTDKFSFYSGVQGTNAQYQHAMRLRDNEIPHYIFCPERSFIRDKHAPRTYAVKAYEQILTEKISQSTWLAAATSEDPEAAMKVMRQAFERNNDEWWKLSLKLDVLRKYEKDNYRKCLVYVLEENGHEVEFETWDIDEDIAQEEKEAKEINKKKHALELKEAQEYATLDEANKVAKGNPKKEIQRRIEKTRLLDRLPGIQESKIWSVEFIYEFYLKKKDFITKQYRYFALVNPEISNKKREVDWFFKSTSEHFSKISIKGLAHDIVRCLRELNVLQFTNGEFHKDCPEVIEFYNLVVNDRIYSEILNPGKQTESGKERTELIKKCLDAIGYKLKSAGKKTIDGVRKPVYFATADSPIERDEILKCIQRKYENYLTSSVVKKVCWKEQDIEPIPITEVVAEQQPVVNADNTITVEPTPVYQYEQQQQPETIAQINNDAISQVDIALQKAYLGFDLKQLSTEELWRRRIDRSLLLSEDVARRVYQSLHQSSQQLLNNVWARLTPGVQGELCQLFA